MTQKKSKSSLVVATVEVEQPFTPAQNQALKMALELNKVGVHFRDKFREFIMFAKNNLTPKEIPPVLRQAGFNDQRCSEMKKICCLPEADFNQYATGQIGWRPALEKARAATRQKTGHSRKNDFVPVIKAARKFIERAKGSIKRGACLFAPSPDGVADVAKPHGVYVLVLDGSATEYEFSIEGRVVHVALSSVKGK